MLKFKKVLFFSLLSLLSIHFVVGSVSEEFPEEFLVQDVENGDNLVRVKLQSWFSAIQPDLLHFIKKSYVLTKREDNASNFLHANLIIHPNIGTVSETGHAYYRDRNFSGVHGLVEPSSILRTLFGCCMGATSGNFFKGELDFPGFVSLVSPCQGCPYHVIVVTWRGSQGEDFQPLGGKSGASWVTNFDATPADIESAEFGFEGQLHAGYLTKLIYSDDDYETILNLQNNGKIDNPVEFESLDNLIYPLSTSITRIINLVPKDQRHMIRFVVTGHSQGGGLAQVALPYIIKKFGSSLPGFIDNITTPRFFGYFLSAPRVAHGTITAQNYEAYVGHDNMISHQAFRDIVPIASLDNFKLLGHLACDSAYDVLYRGVASEIAHNNRMILVNKLQKALNYDLFNTENKNYWVLKSNPELVLCWREFVRLMTYNVNDSREISLDYVCQLFNGALRLYRLHENIYHNSLFEPKTFNYFNRANISWNAINSLCKDKLSTNGIMLDNERRAVLERVERNISQDTVTYSESGLFNGLALIDTALDHREATHLTNRTCGNCGELMRRIFCCSCFFSDDNTDVSTPYFFDRQFYYLLQRKPGKIQKYPVSPAGAMSITAYLHYGSQANGFDGKYFDKSMPSRNLPLSLKNGYNFLKNPYAPLESEKPKPIIPLN